MLSDELVTPPAVLAKFESMRGVVVQLQAALDAVRSKFATVGLQLSATKTKAMLGLPHGHTPAH